MLKIDIITSIMSNVFDRHASPAMIAEMASKMLSVPNGIVFNPDKKGYNSATAITASFILSREDKMLFLKIYKYLIKLMESKIRENKINYKKIQKQIQKGDESVRLPTYDYHMILRITILYELRHFIRGKFNK